LAPGGCALMPFKNPATRPIIQRCLAVAAAVLAAGSARAEMPEFDEVFKRVVGCSLDPARYDLAGRLRGQVDAVILALPTSGAVRGLLVNGFYFAPGRQGGDQYGLVINAPLDVVANAFPELAGRQTVNGYLRRLVRLSDETGDTGARRKTLLSCTAGTDV
jgi:hypothetical protein